MCFVDHSSVTEVCNVMKFPFSIQDYLGEEIWDPVIKKFYRKLSSFRWNIKYCIGKSVCVIETWSDAYFCSLRFPLRWERK